MATPRAKSRPKLWTFLSPILALISLIIGGLILIRLQLPTPSKTDQPVEIQVGNHLPDFALTRLDGSATQISELKSKIFLINFWATWCEACMDEMPTLIKLHAAYKNKGFEILGVNLDENPETMVPKTLKQYGIDFSIYKDPDGKTAELFDVHAIPLTVIIDNQRKILFIKDGGMNWNSPTIHTQVEQWLSG